MTATMETVLITGASSGIGRATAVRLSSRCNLILHGRDQDRLKETLSLCEDPGRQLLWNFDLEDSQGLSNSLCGLLAGLERPVTSFVHCAGTVQVLPFKATTVAIMQRTFAVNVISAGEILRVLDNRLHNGHHLSSAVFVSSIWGRFGSRGHTAYCASKAALDGLARALAVELAPRVRVNSVLPGAVETAMAAATLEDPQIRDRLRADYPLGLGFPEDVAATIAFLISEEARWITGQAFTVDGGRTANMSLK